MVLITVMVDVSIIVDVLLEFSLEALANDSYGPSDAVAALDCSLKNMK
jgi:hypothetical protein